MENEKKSSIQSVDRAIAILRCFQDNDSLRGTEIGKMLSLNKSTVFGLIRALEKNNCLTQDQESGKYLLGNGILQLGLMVNRDLRAIVNPYLEELLNLSQETVSLAARDNENVFFIEKKEMISIVKSQIKRNYTLPLYCTAVGKVIMAFLPDDEIKYILNKLPLRSFTNKTITNHLEIMDELGAIRENGIAFDNEELENGLTCIAAPIFDKNGFPIAAISVSGPSARITTCFIDKISKSLLQFSNEITNKLKGVRV